MKMLTKSALAALTLFAFSAAPASAQSTQDGIAMCRDKLAAEQTLDMDAYRLKFKSSKGSRIKTLLLEAIPADAGERINVTCVIKRDGTVDAKIEA